MVSYDVFKPSSKLRMGSCPFGRRLASLGDDLQFAVDWDFALGMVGAKGGRDP